MTQPFRLAEGGRVDRSRPIAFTFDGKRHEGLLGDTLASALLANGVHLVGRSFKYHRPRGIMAAGSDEPNALVRVGTHPSHHTPNTRATEVELHDELVAESQNRWPSLRCDFGAVVDLLSPLFPAGFYYKTFMWPKRAWQRLYEPAIRAVAGLGRAPTAADAERYTQRYAHCDVLVIGAGPAGLSAASAAAEGGARVMLCDEQLEFGGSLLAEPGARVMGADAWTWVEESVSHLAARASVTLLRRTTAFGFFRDNMVGLVECIADRSLPRPRERLWHVRAREVVFATGAIERPLVFPGNDRPGIMLAGAARAYLHRFGVKAGTRAVVVAGHESAYRAARDVAAAGIEIAAIVDPRATAKEQLTAEAQASGLPVFTNSMIAATSGRLRVDGVRIVETRSGRPVIRRERCDLVLMSHGFTPSVHLFAQSGGTLRFDERLGEFVPGVSVARERSAGACRGIFELSAVIDDGLAAGEEAAKAAGLGGATRYRRSPPESTGAAFQLAAPAGRTTDSKSFVDFQNDVTAKDIALAAQEGFRSVEHIKRYTTVGMATDQGKTSNANALDIAAAVLETPTAQLGLTTFRMPFKPVTFGTLAGLSRGDLFEPVRTTPIHEWAATGRRIRGRRSMETSALLSSSRRGYARRGESRMQSGAHRCRHARRLDAGQDRSSRTRRRRVLESRLHQRLHAPRNRPLPIRDHVARRWLYSRRRYRRPNRGRAVSRHNHHRRLGASSGKNGGSPSDRMDRPRRMAYLDCRSMGGDRGAGAEGVRGPRAPSRRNRPVECRNTSYEPAQRDDRWRTDASVSR